MAVKSDRGPYPMLRQEGADYRLCPTAGGGVLGDMLHESDLNTRTWCWQ